MSEDAAITEALLTDNIQSLSWHGSIPVELTLSRYDVTDLRTPDPIYLMLPRMSYLHVAAAEAIEELQKSSLLAMFSSGKMLLGGEMATSQNSEDDEVGFGGQNKNKIENSSVGDDSISSSSSTINVDNSPPASAASVSNLSCSPGPSVWFSHQTTPLHFNLPIGVLFDLSTLKTGLTSKTSSTSLPWKLTVHFSSYPSLEILAYSGMKSIETFFSQSLKQALFLEHGSARVAMALNKENHRILWTAIKRNDFDSYRGINSKLLADITRVNNNKSGEDVGLNDDEIRTSEIRKRLDKEKVEKEISPSSSPPPPTTNNLPAISSIPIRIISTDHSSPTIQLPITDLNFTFAQTLAFCNVDISRRQNMTINGIDAMDVPLDCNIAEIWRTCQCADHFLYICVKN